MLRSIGFLSGAAGLLLGLGAVTTVLAPGTAASQDDPQLTRTQHQDWGSICAALDTGPRCDIQQTVTAELPGGASLTLQVVLSMQEGRRMMELVFPLAMDLQAGIALKIDGGPETQQPYAVCVAQGCVVLVAVDDALLAAMRAGALLHVGFRPFGVQRTLVLDVSLRGFTSASNELR